MKTYVWTANSTLYAADRLFYAETEILCDGEHVAKMLLSAMDDTGDSGRPDGSASVCLCCDMFHSVGWYFDSHDKAVRFCQRVWPKLSSEWVFDAYRMVRKGFRMRVDVDDPDTYDLDAFVHPDPAT